MPLCRKCGNPYEDGVRNCPCCGTASDSTDSPDISNNTLPQPIWLTRSIDDPLDDLSEDSLHEDPFGHSSDLQQNSIKNRMHDDSSYEPSQGDFFDGVVDSASSLYSNMSPKMRKFLLWTLIGTLLSLILFFYISCAHHKDTTGGSSINTSYEDNPLEIYKP